MEGSMLKPDSAWCRKAGQGMGRVLYMADELGSYTLTESRYLASSQGKAPQWDLLFEGDERLYNHYGILAVSPDINYQDAMSLINWITPKQGQQIIRDYRIDNELLFFPLVLTD